MANYLVPRIRQVPEKSKALVGDGVGSSQASRQIVGLGWWPARGAWEANRQQQAPALAGALPACLA